MYAWNTRKNYKEIWKILIKCIYKKSTLFLIYFKNYRDCGYTCNPRKFEIPALGFPRKDPVNPCKHFQCSVHPIIECSSGGRIWTWKPYAWWRIFPLAALLSWVLPLPKQPMNGSGPRTIVIRFFLVVTLLNYNIPNSMTSLVEQ